MTEWKETEIIPRIPSTWTEFKLEKIGHFKNGVNFSAESFGAGYPVINVKQLYKGRFPTIEGLDEIVPEAVKRIDEYELKKGDLLFVRSSVTLEGTGQIVMVNELPKKRTVFSGFIIRFRLFNQDVSSSFLNYLLRTKYYKEHFINIAAGTSIINLSQDTLKNISVFVPTPKDQEAISHTLGCIDDKIDLLQRQNATLEKMAETLFRQWFVEEAKEEWETNNLSFFADFFNGKSRPNEEGTIPIYGGNGILGYANKSNYSGKSIIIGRVGAYCGSLYYENKEIWVSDNALLVKSKQDNTTHFLFYLLKTLDLNSMAEGSSHPLLTQTLLKSIEIQIPPTQKINEFDRIVEDIQNKIESNQTQIRTLTALRDTLLPKFMSGEIKVEI